MLPLQSNTRTLTEHLHREGTLSEQEAREILGQLVLALAALHASGRFHGEVHPSNVILGPKGEVTLRQPDLLSGTSAEVVPGYSSPEQYSVDRVRIGPASDIYGLAATAYAILSGVAPRDALDRLASPDRVGWVRRALGAAGGAEFCSLLEHGLAPQVEERPKRMEAWWGTLPVRRPATTGEPERFRVGRLALIWAAGIVATIGLFLILSSLGPSTPTTSVQLPEARQIAHTIPSGTAGASPTATAPGDAGGMVSTRPMEGVKAGEQRVFGGVEMVWCPAGSFVRGSPESEAGRDSNEIQHRVALSRGFWLGKFECTQSQWTELMWTGVEDLRGAGNPENTFGVVTATGPDVPVYFISWTDTQSWLGEMNRRHPLPEGWRWDLPTEAQWEYACRAGTTTATYGGLLTLPGPNHGPELDPFEWYAGNSSNGYRGLGVDTTDWDTKQYPGGVAGARRVGLKRPNPWGLHDMLGNVREWCRDWYEEYPLGESTDPSGPASGKQRVLRGGGWDYNAYCSRSAYRSWAGEDYKRGSLGFRPAIVPADH